MQIDKKIWAIGNAKIYIVTYIFFVLGDLSGLLNFLLVTMSQE